MQHNTHCDAEYLFVFEGREGELKEAPDEVKMFELICQLLTKLMITVSMASMIVSENPRKQV